MDGVEFRQRGKEMVDYIVDYLDNVGSKRVSPDVKPGYLRPLLPSQAPQNPEPWDDIMRDVESKIMPGVLHWNHPHFFAYFASGNSYPTILADMLSDALAMMGFSWAAGPVCTELEIIMLDWYAKAIGLPEEFISTTAGSKGGGVIQGSASECILVTMLAARHHALEYLRQQEKENIKSRRRRRRRTDNGDLLVEEEEEEEEEEEDETGEQSRLLHKLVVYCSREAHSCVEKAAKICLVKMRVLEPDERGSLRGETLKQAMDEDRARGLTPFYVSCIIGSTASCTFDNLEEIGAVCRNQEIDSSQTQVECLSQNQSGIKCQSQNTTKSKSSQDCQRHTPEIRVNCESCQNQMNGISSQNLINYCSQEIGDMCPSKQNGMLSEVNEVSCQSEESGKNCQSQQEMKVIYQSQVNGISSQDQGISDKCTNCMNQETKVLVNGISSEEQDISNCPNCQSQVTRGQVNGISSQDQDTSDNCPCCQDEGTKLNYSNHHTGIISPNQPQINNQSKSRTSPNQSQIKAKYRESANNCKSCLVNGISSQNQSSQYNDCQSQMNGIMSQNQFKYPRQNQSSGLNCQNHSTGGIASQTQGHKTGPPVWMHVDCAYAGSAFLCPELRPLMAGIEYADSVNTNPNKWMLTCFDCSCLWVKDKLRLTRGMDVNPIYLQHDYDDQLIDFRHWQIPLSRRFRSLKLFFLFRSYGIQGLQNYIRNHIQLAKYFESLVLKDARFEICNEVKLGLVCFRLKGPDLWTQELLAKINASGRIHMIPGVRRKRYFIRFAVTYEHAKEEHIRYAWKVTSHYADTVLEKMTTPVAATQGVHNTPRPRLSSRQHSFTRGVSRDVYKARSTSLYDGVSPIPVVDDDNDDDLNNNVFEEAFAAKSV